MNYAEFYHMISGPFRRNENLQRGLILFNMYFTYTMYLLYPCLLAYLLFAQRGLFLRTLLIPGLFFAALTYVRKQINRPRPYEKWKLDKLLIKETKGNSMPSRHVFSAVIIAMAVLQVSAPLGSLLLVLSVLSCAVRVLLGVHYPSDVIIGYLFGILAGNVMFLL